MKINKAVVDRSHIRTSGNRVIYCRNHAQLVYLLVLSLCADVTIHRPYGYSEGLMNTGR